MTDEPITTSATTADVNGIVGPTNATVTATGPVTASYVVSAHAPTPRPLRRDDRVSLAGIDPMEALRAMLRTPPLAD